MLRYETVYESVDGGATVREEIDCAVRFTKLAGTVSGLGQERTFADVRVTSALPLRADSKRIHFHMTVP
jgi:hypothetical protein